MPICVYCNIETGAGGLFAVTFAESFVIAMIASTIPPTGLRPLRHK